MTDFLFGGMVQANTPINITSALVAANVSVTGSGIPTNGVFLSAANTLAFATNSTQVVTIASNGNVGIGSSTPAVALDVTGSTNISGNLSVSGTATLANPSISGNIALSGTVSTGGNITVGSNLQVNGSYFNVTATGARITADFSNGTLANRAMFQTSTVNGNTILGLIPNGSATLSQINLFSQADPTNSSIGQLINLNTEISLRSAAAGSGTLLPLTFYTSGAERLRITANGNLEIGATTQTTNPTAGLVINNINGGGTEWVNNNNGGGNVSALSTGGLAFGTFTGAVGSESVTERMRIDASGNMGIGTPSPSYPLTVVSNSSSVGLAVYGRSSDNLSGAYWFSNTGATTYGTILASATEYRITSTPAAAVQTFFTNGLERMRITSTGNVGIGSTTPQQTLDVSGNVNVLNTVIMGSSFLRNRIINGSMQVSQRQAVNVGSNVPTSGQGYGPDRFWGVATIASTIVLFQVTKNLAGFTYALRVQRNVSSTNAATWYVGQTIESFNCQDLAGQTVTFSFYLSAGAQYSGSGVTVQVWTGTGTDEGTTALNSATWTGQTLLLNLTIIPSTTWTKYSYAVPVGAGINEMAVRWNSTTSGTAGAQDSIDISGVQLEPGPVATLYERRLYGTELSLCQRYYWINSSATNSVSYYMPVFAYSTTLAFGVIEFPVTMRTTPTISTTGTPANYRIILGGTAYALTGGPAIDQATPYSSSISFTTAGTLTVGQAGMAGANSSTAAFLGFNAEL